jgi:hypothetical protein
MQRHGHLVAVRADQGDPPSELLIPARQQGHTHALDEFLTSESLGLRDPGDVLDVRLGISIPRGHRTVGLGQGFGQPFHE